MGAFDEVVEGGVGAGQVEVAPEEERLHDLGVEEGELAFECLFGHGAPLL
jgi:hypothetical protein